MSSLKKITTTRYMLDGRQVPSGTPGAAKIKTKSAKWYGQFRDATGKLKCIPLDGSKERAKHMLAALMERVRDEVAGLSNKYADANQVPLADHIAEYKAQLAAKGTTALHVGTQLNRINSIVDGCGFNRITDIDADAVLGWLAKRRASQTFGLSSSNHYITAIKGLALWLQKSGRCPDNRLINLDKLNAKSDNRRNRRVLSPEDFATLLKATQESTRIDSGRDWQFTPDDRVMLYLTAAYTGLRASELASLKPSNIDWKHSTITIESAYSKNREEATLPLWLKLANKLKTYIKGKPVDAPLWPGTWAAHRRAGQILKRDLRDAGIPFEDSRKRRFDFHALRCQFASNLARAEVHPSIAQKLMRHKSIGLTMDVYTKTDLGNMESAIAKLTMPE